MKKSRTVRRAKAVESPSASRLPPVELLVDTKAELLDLTVRSGLQVLHAKLEEDRTAICGPRYKHPAARTASRAGTVASEVVLGGRKVPIRRPRVRAGRHEVPLPTFQAMAQTDPLQRRTGEQLLVGVSTRGYAWSLEPLPAEVPSRSVSKSAVSRQAMPLDALDLVGLVLDGVHIGEYCLVVTLGIGADGTKPALGLWEGSTENATVCQSLLANLQSRGLRTDRSLPVMLDGSTALRAAVRAVFGQAALVQRCQVHKARNILDHLRSASGPGCRRSSAVPIRAPTPRPRSGCCAISRGAWRWIPRLPTRVIQGLGCKLVIGAQGIRIEAPFMRRRPARALDEGLAKAAAFSG